MKTSLTRSLLALPLICLASCSEPADENPTVTEWLGAELHGEMHGEAEGERVDVVAEASEVACKREYAVPDPSDTTTFADGWLKEFEISFLVTVDGIERRYEIEIFNFKDATEGSSWTVVPEVTEGAPIGAEEVHVELQWEWEVDSMLVSYEEIATGGTIEIEELSGMVGADGLVIPANEGNVGGFIELELPDGEVAISFTAPCTVVEVEPIE